MTPDINLSHLTPATRTVPASVFGEHLAGERDCLGYQVETLPAFASTRIPVLNPCHFFNEAHYRTLAAWWNLARREPIYVSGPSGSGKTSTAMQFCARLGIPVVSVTARARMDRRELLGHWALQGGETRWIDGPALLAWKHGWTLLINEFSATPADMWVSCNDILEGLPLDNGATGELVVPHSMTRVIVTDNTRGHSSEIDEGFFGRQIQDRSVMADQDWLAEFEPEVLDRLFKALARLGADSRAAAQAQAIGFESRAVPLSFRVLSRMRNMMLDAARMPAASDDDPLRRIIRTSLTEALDSTAREAAETLAVTAIGNLIHEMRVSRARMVLKNATGSALKTASV